MIFFEYILTRALKFKIFLIYLIVKTQASFIILKLTKETIIFLKKVHANLCQKLSFKYVYSKYYFENLFNTLNS